MTAYILYLDLYEIKTECLSQSSLASLVENQVMECKCSNSKSFFQSFISKYLETLSSCVYKGKEGV